MRPAIAVVLLVAILASAVPLSAPPARAADALLLRVGSIDEMKTRNPLPPMASDVWTEDVLERVYDRPVKERPEGFLRAFLAKGIDADEDGMFEPGEYGVWSETPPARTPLTVTVYYDFNGAQWHDGTQMTVWDLFLSYHLAAMNARFSTDLRVVFCTVSASYESCGRQLSVAPVAMNWEGDGTMPGDPALRAAVEFRLTAPYALFAERTLAPLLFPSHVWSRTGGGRHADFGCAVWIPPAEASAKGISDCGATDPARWGRGIASTDSVPNSFPFRYSSAEGWSPKDADVIGSGPFRFRSWMYGVEVLLDRFEDYYVGGVYDPLIAAYLRAPRITGIQFLRMGTTSLLVYALKQGEIDVIRGNVGPYWFPELFPDPNVAFEANADPGFFYMAYNFRREPWGYANGDPAQGDRGYWFRQAVSHLVDKKSIVQNLLQNFGVIGHGVVSPANTFWYNDNIPKPGYDLATARAILDDLATPGGIYDPGFTLDPGTTTDCNKDDPSGCRGLPRIGNQVFEIMVPQADYDPVRAYAATMIAEAMRQVGLNAKTGPPPPYFPFCYRDFDLYILGWRIGGTDPDYLFSFFHSSNSPCGQNYPGVQNATLDVALDASRREMNREVRRQYIFEAQRLLADLRPYEVLYYQTNIEAYRQDRFVNWTVASGTIWNEWSLFEIHPPGSRALKISIEGETSLRAGEESGFTFTVRDLEGNPAGGATLVADVSSPIGQSPGILRADSQEGTSLTLAVEAGGRARLTYAAPLFFESSRPIVLHATAAHPGYEQGADVSTVLTVFGGEEHFLRVRIDLPVGDVTYPEAPLPVSITVSDAAGTIIQTAAVTLAAIPYGTADPASGTADDVATATVSFPEPGVYTISVRATKDGYRDAFGYVTIWVIAPPTARPSEPLGGASPIDAAALGIVAGTVIGAAVPLVVWRYLWSRRKARDK